MSVTWKFIASYINITGIKNYSIKRKTNTETSLPRSNTSCFVEYWQYCMNCAILFCAEAENASAQHCCRGT